MFNWLRKIFFWEKEEESKEVKRLPNDDPDKHHGGILPPHYKMLVKIHFAGGKCVQKSAQYMIKLYERFTPNLRDFRMEIIDPKWSDDKHAVVALEYWDGSTQYVDPVLLRSTFNLSDWTDKPFETLPQKPTLECLLEKKKYHIGSIERMS